MSGKKSITVMTQLWGSFGRRNIHGKDFTALSLQPLVAGRGITKSAFSFSARPYCSAEGTTLKTLRKQLDSQRKIIAEQGLLETLNANANKFQKEQIESQEKRIAEQNDIIRALRLQMVKGPDRGNCIRAPDYTETTQSSSIVEGIILKKLKERLDSHEENFEKHEFLLEALNAESKYFEKKIAEQELLLGTMNEDISNKLKKKIGEQDLLWGRLFAESNNLKVKVAGKESLLGTLSEDSQNFKKQITGLESLLGTLTEDSKNLKEKIAGLELLGTLTEDSKNFKKKTADQEHTKADYDTLSMIKAYLLIAFLTLWGWGLEIALVRYPCFIREIS